MMEGMSECDQLKSFVIIQRFAKPLDTSTIPKTQRLETFLRAGINKPPPAFVRIEFQDPGVIVFSSGTTGTPKAIVHAVGPMFLSCSKENHVHRDIQHHDVGLQFTITGWIMYLGSISPMVYGARCVAYDGSPLVPDSKVLLRIAAEQKVTILGAGPRLMGEWMKRDIKPREEFDLGRLRTVISTGMVLPERMFEWFYDKGFPARVQLANITGGTDIVSSLVSLSPLLRWMLMRINRLAPLLRRTPWIPSTSAAAKTAPWASPSPPSTTISPTAAPALRSLPAKQAISSPRRHSPTSPSFSGTTAPARPRDQSTARPTLSASRAYGPRATFARSIPLRERSISWDGPTGC